MFKVNLLILKKNVFVSIHRMSGGGIPLGNVESQSPSNPDIPASHGYNEDFWDYFSK